MDKREREYFEQIERKAEELINLIDLIRYYNEAKDSVYLDAKKQFKMAVDNTNKMFGREK